MECRYQEWLVEASPKTAARRLTAMGLPGRLGKQQGRIGNSVHSWGGRLRVRIGAEHRMVKEYGLMFHVKHPR